MERLEEMIKKGADHLREQGIDRKKVMQAAQSIAKKVFGDKVDQKKVKGMVDKAISIGKDTEDAIGAVQGFFQEK